MQIYHCPNYQSFWPNPEPSSVVVYSQYCIYIHSMVTCLQTTGGCVGGYAVIAWPCCFQTNADGRWTESIGGIKIEENDDGLVNVGRTVNACRIMLCFSVGPVRTVRSWEGPGLWADGKLPSIPVHHHGDVDLVWHGSIKNLWWYCAWVAITLASFQSMTGNWIWSCMLAISDRARFALVTAFWSSFVVAFINFLTIL